LACLSYLNLFCVHQIQSLKFVIVINIEVTKYFDSIIHINTAQKCSKKIFLIKDGVAEYR